MKTNINIKMRLNKSPESLCELCGANHKQSLNLFDLKLGSLIITICDKCNNELLQKSLKAQCYVDNRTKDGHDISVRNVRGEERFKGVNRDVTIKGLNK